MKEAGIPYNWTIHLTTAQQIIIATKIKSWQHAITAEQYFCLVDTVV
jgi:hypothetical protein